MTPDEREVWRTHFERLQRLLREGVMILVGPTLGTVNTGIAASIALVGIASCCCDICGSRKVFNGLVLATLDRAKRQPALGNARRIG